MNLQYIHADFIVHDNGFTIRALQCHYMLQGNYNICIVHAMQFTTNLQCNVIHHSYIFRHSRISTVNILFQTAMSLQYYRYHYTIIIIIMIMIMIMIIIIIT